MKLWNLASIGGAALGIVGVFAAAIGWLCLIAIGEQTEKSENEKGKRA